MSVARAGIALGSNLGDCPGHLRAALACLGELAVAGEPVLSASIYRTAPRLCPPGSPDFLNTVVEIGFAGGPLELLEATRAIEKKLGRAAGGARNAPRVIDLDLLYLGDAVSAGEVLELPHPRIGERRFVLEPLAEIRPELVLPGHCETIAAMLARLPADDAARVALTEML